MKFHDGSDFAADDVVFTVNYVADAAYGVKTHVTPGQCFMLEKNENYQDSPKGQPSIGKVDIRTIPDVNAQMAELFSGTLDMIWQVPSDQAEKLAEMGQFTVANESTMRVGYLAMDAAGRSGEGPFTDIRVRKAVNHAINREENSVAGLFDAPRHLYTQALLKSVLSSEPGLGVPDTQLGMAYPNPIAPPAGCHFHPRCPRATKLCRNTAPQAVAIPQGHVACHLHDPQTVMYEQG